MFKQLRLILNEMTKSDFEDEHHGNNGDRGPNMKPSHEVDLPLLDATKAHRGSDLVRRDLDIFVAHRTAVDAIRLPTSVGQTTPLLSLTPMKLTMSPKPLPQVSLPGDTLKTTLIYNIVSVFRIAHAFFHTLFKPDISSVPIVL
jgi:hypothetical protein